MASRGHAAVGLCLLIAWSGNAAARNPHVQQLGFTLTTNLGIGNELFVVGNQPEVGNWDPTRGAKLYWTAGNVWTGRVGLRSGTAIDFKFVALTNSPTGVCEPANVRWIPPGTGNHSTTSSLPEADAPYAGKTVFYHSGLTNVSIIYSSAGSAFTASILTVVGPGRSPGEFLHQVSGIGEAGESLEFVMTGFSGTNQIYDHAPYGGYGSPNSNYYTTLDALFVQDGDVFNYRPPATVSPPSIISSNAESHHAPSPSRTMKIYLPRGYTQNTWKRYPVIYMHDGENVFAPGGTFGSWDADLTATKETSQGRMREVIIVALNSSGSLRTREYLPPEDNSGGQGFGDVYANFLVYDVKTNIDARFRTQTNAENTLTIGASSGGLITTYLGWNTNVFGKIGPFSPAYLISPNFNARIQAEAKRDIRIFTETGNVGSPEDIILPDTWTVLDYFLQDGYVQNADLVSRLGCGQSHNEATWASWLPECYQFLLNIWDEPNYLAQELNPPRITNLAYSATTGVASVDFPSLRGFGYQVEASGDLPGWGWVGVSTTAVETLPWSSKTASSTSSPASTTSRFLRVRVR